MTAATMQSAFDGAEIINIWAKPEPSILTAGRRPAVPMPGEMFGPCWGMLQDIADGAGCPVDYVAVGFITACASLIGAKRRAVPFAERPDWKEPPIIWAGAVGDPSAAKSPGLDAVTAPLRKIEREHAEDHKEQLNAFLADKERARAEKEAWAASVKKAASDNLSTPPIPRAAIDPEEPHRRRLIVTDATPEAMGSILAGNRSGTLHFRDELAGWLLSFERYSPGGREFWLESFGGRSFVVDRKGAAGPLIVEFNGVSVIGGIQPDKMASALLSAADDGLVARFLWAWPDPIPFRRPSKSGDMARLENIYRTLDKLEWAYDADGKETALHIPLAADAADLFEQWVIENDRGIDDAGSLYKNFCGKLRGLVVRLALVMELAQWADQGGPQPKVIRAATVGLVADFIDGYAKPMAQRVYGDAALPQVERDAAVIARHLVRFKLSNFNAKRLRREKGFHGPRKPEAMAAAVELLTECGWIMPAGKRSGDTPGRQSMDFIVNPGVLANG